jgi:hypothetical protein
MTTLSSIFGIDLSPRPDLKFGARLRRQFEQPEFDREVATYIQQLRELFEGKSEDENERSAHLLKVWKQKKAMILTQSVAPSDTLVAMLLAECGRVGLLDTLPAGHGPEHFLSEMRDIHRFVCATELDFIDDLERTIALCAGLLHDIGNAVVDRYAEQTNFTSHAEAGAWVLERVTTHIFALSPDMTQLIQYAMAAHTHYLKSITKTRNGNTFVQAPYPRLLLSHTAGDLWAIKLVRMADREQLKGLTVILRNITIHTKSIVNMSDDTFEAVSESEKSDFLWRFAVPGSDQSYLEKYPAVTSIFESALRFADKFDESNAYTEYDTAAFYQSNNTQKADIQAALALMQHTATTTKIKESFLVRKTLILSHFLAFLRHIDPAADIETVRHDFALKFEWLPPHIQAAWLSLMEQYTLPDGMYAQFLQHSFAHNAHTSWASHTSLLNASLAQVESMIQRSEHYILRYYHMQQK